MAFLTEYVLVLSGLTFCRGFDISQSENLTTTEKPSENVHADKQCNFVPENITWNFTSFETNERPERNIVVNNEGKSMQVNLYPVKCYFEETNIQYYCRVVKNDIVMEIFQDAISVSTLNSRIKITCNANNNNERLIWIFVSTKNNETAVKREVASPILPWNSDGGVISSLIFEAVKNRSGLYICFMQNKNTNCIFKPLYAEYVEITEETELSSPLPKGEQENSEDPKDKSATITAISIVVVMATVLITAIAVYFTVKIRKQKKIFNNRQTNFQLGQINPDLPLDEQVELLPYDPQWEFPKSRLKLGKVIGHGAFGRVIKADAIGLDSKVPYTTVAVKMLKDKDDEYQYKSLMAELKIMIHLGKHVNILNLLGAVTKNIHKGELMVMVEYCCYDNLRSYLMKNRKRFINQIDPETGKLNPDILWENKLESTNDNTGRSVYNNPPTPDRIHSSSSCRNAEQLKESSIETTGSTSVGIDITGGDTSAFTVKSNESGYDSPGEAANYSFGWKEAIQNSEIITTSTLICYCFQCAQGMEYLASKKLIHRDLAARNILLAEGNVIKISDFGLSKDVYKDPKYVKTMDGPLPVKWMAVESVKDGVFTTKSDVWSFAILMWEMFTLGENPYPEFETYEMLFKRLLMGYRLQKPKYSPDDVYRVMLDCWQINPEDRPDFSFLGKLFGDMLEASSKQHYLDLNDAYTILNADPQSIEDLNADADDNLGEASNDVDTFGKLRRTSVDDGSTLNSNSEVKKSKFDPPATIKRENEPKDISVLEAANPETDRIYNETASIEIGLNLQRAEIESEKIEEKPDTVAHTENLAAGVRLNCLDSESENTADAFYNDNVSTGTALKLDCEEMKSENQIRDDEYNEYLSMDTDIDLDCAEIECANEKRGVIYTKTLPVETDVHLDCAEVESDGDKGNRIYDKNIQKETESNLNCSGMESSE